MTAPSAVANAIHQGAHYLRSRQAQDGHWQDYQLPVGPSDAWVTAYVGLALARTQTEACPQSQAAADWLCQHRPYPAGWGYNGHTGADADSTAYALQLLRRTARPYAMTDVAWLRSHWQATGGFATYHRADAWGIAHGDVTPVVYLALNGCDPAQDLAPEVRRYLAAHRQADGTWPAYWWRTHHYATYWSLLALRSLGEAPSGAVPVVDPRETHAVHNAFDLALVTGIAHLQGAAPGLIDQLSGKLIGLQSPDGAWPGGANLRVTAPDCHYPAEAIRGQLYTDTNHLITTATALRVLADLHTNA